MHPVVSPISRLSTGTPSIVLPVAYATTTLDQPRVLGTSPHGGVVPSYKQVVWPADHHELDAARREKVAKFPGFSTTPLVSGGVQLGGPKPTEAAAERRDVSAASRTPQPGR